MIAFDPQTSMACSLQISYFNYFVVRLVTLPPATHKKDSPTAGIQERSNVVNCDFSREETMTRFSLSITLPLALAALSSGAADDSTKTRVGTCSDAKSQMEYFCNPDNAASDSMVAIGTACTNAKNNVKEACEGIVEPDKTYEFDDKKKN
jgi:hypothetical protein